MEVGESMPFDEMVLANLPSCLELIKEGLMKMEKLTAFKQGSLIRV